MKQDEVRFRAGGVEGGPCSTPRSCMNATV